MCFSNREQTWFLIFIGHFSSPNTISDNCISNNYFEINKTNYQFKKKKSLSDNNIIMNAKFLEKALKMLKKKTLRKCNKFQQNAK